MSIENTLTRLQRFIPYVLFLVALVVNIGNWLRVATVEAFQLGSLLHDDGYYYLVIAENIINGNGITFDGINPTTGFQPLYQSVTVGIVLLSQWMHVSVFRWIYFVNLILTGLSALIIGGTMNKISLSPQPILVYLLAGIILPLNFPLVFKRLSAGMEMALALLFLSLLLQSVCSEKTRQSNLWFRFREGLLLGVLTLIRIDYAILRLFSRLSSFLLGAGVGSGS